MATVAAGAMTENFVSDGSDDVYTFNTLSQIEGTRVTLQDEGSYLVSTDFTISEGDVLQLQNNDIIKMANVVRLTINGDADFATADSIMNNKSREKRIIKECVLSLQIEKRTQQYGNIRRIGIQRRNQS